MSPTGIRQNSIELLMDPLPPAALRCNPSVSSMFASDVESAKWMHVSTWTALAELVGLRIEDEVP